jgi:hypothetical protein
MTSFIMSETHNYATILALLVVGTLAGFIAGRQTAPEAPVHLFPEPTRPGTKEEAPVPDKKSKGKGVVNLKDDCSGSEDDEDDEGIAGELPNEDGRLANHEECKLVLVVRTDLGMTKGTRSYHTKKDLQKLKNPQAK